MSSPLDVIIDLVDKLLSSIKQVKTSREGCESLARKVRSTLGIVLRFDEIPFGSSVETAVELVKDTLKEAQETIDKCCQTSLFFGLLYHENHDVAIEHAIVKLENAYSQISLAQNEIYSDMQTNISDLPHQLNRNKFEETAAMAHQVQELRDVLERGFFQERQQMEEVKELVQKVILKHIQTREEIKAQIDLVMKEILGARKDKEAQMEYELNEVIAAMNESMKATSKPKDRFQDFKDGLLCPISKDTMSDPVILNETGNTYDRQSIQKWFELGHSKDPLSMVEISSKELVPDLVLQDVCLTILGKPRKSISASRPNTKEPAPPFELGLYEGYGKWTNDTSTILVQQMIIFEPNGKVIGCSLYKQENTQDQDINLQIGSGQWDGKRLHLYYRDNWYNLNGNIDLILTQGEYVLKWNGKMNARRGLLETTDSAFLYRPPSIVTSINLHPGIYQLENAFFNTKENITYKAKVMISLHTNWKVEGWMWLKATGPHPNFEARIQEGKWSHEGSIEFNVVFQQNNNQIESQTKPINWLNVFELSGNITQDESSHLFFNAKLAKKSNQEKNLGEQSCHVPLDCLDSLEFLCIRKASAPWNHIPQDPLRVVQALKNCEVKLVKDIIGTTIEVNLGLLPYNQDAMNRLSIYIASQQNYIDIFKVLICNGASVQSLDKKEWTLLHLASFYNSINIINDLIAKGATIELQDNDGCTALHLASQNNSIDVAKVLIAYGANVQLQTKDGWSSLHLASQNNSIDVVKELIAKGANIELLDMNGNTALHIGSSNNSIDVVKELIAKCATLDIQNKNGASPLYFASQQNNVDVVKELIINGADVNLENMNGESPLHIASQHNYVDIAKELIANGANIELQNKDGSTPLHIASQHNSIDVFKELIANNADINIQNQDGSSPLHIATQKNSIEVVKELIAKRTYINLQDNDGWTPLHIAIHNDSIDIAKELIAEGAYLDCQDNHGRTLLHMVLQKNMVDIFMEIIELGINVDLQDNDGRSPLHIASQNNSINIVKELNATWAKINVQDKDGYTPLYIASQMNSIDVAKELIAHGANIDLQNKNGRSPLWIASQFNTIDVAKELIAHGANIDLQNKNGASPLYSAARHNSIDVAKELIAHDANIDLQNKNGWTSLHIASWNNSIEVAKELIDHSANVTQQTFDGLTPLHIASACGRVSIVKVLLENVYRKGTKNNIGPPCFMLFILINQLVSMIDALFSKWEK
eukprot:g8145.t1